MSRSGAGLIHILYFAWLRERTGCGEEMFELAEGASTVAALIDRLRARNAGYASAFARPRLVRCAVNQVFAGPDTLVEPGDEVAFFPPVTGG
jgi:molybdopterin converting factor subunit 1